MEARLSRRRLYLDESFGERRGVVTLEGRPERLLIERQGETAVAAGARFVARLTRLDRANGLGFLNLGQQEAVLNLGPEAKGLAQGAAVEVEVRSEARRA